MCILLCVAKIDMKDDDTMEADAIMKLVCNFTAEFRYSLDRAEFQQCKYTYIHCVHVCTYRFWWVQTLANSLQILVK